MILRAESDRNQVSQDSASYTFSSSRTEIKEIYHVCKTEDLTLNKQLLNKTAKKTAAKQ
jgi:hypothetical protein